MGGLVLKEIINFFVLLVSLSFMLASNLNALTIYEAIEKVVNNSPELRIIFEKKNQVIEDYKETKSSYMPKVYFVFNKGCQLLIIYLGQKDFQDQGCQIVRVSEVHCMLHQHRSFHH